MLIKEIMELEQFGDATCAIKIGCLVIVHTRATIGLNIFVGMRKSRMELCDKNCNKCPLVIHPNSRMVTKVLNELLNKFGDDVYPVVQNLCANLTVCYDCHIDDFCHEEDCELM
jgi:hypothetical protein